MKVLFLSSIAETQYVVYLIIHTSLWHFPSFEPCHQKNNKIKVIVKNDGCLKNFKKYPGRVFIKMEVILGAFIKEVHFPSLLSEKITLLLRICLVKNVKSNLKHCKLKVIFESSRKLNMSFRYTDALNKKISSDIFSQYD